MKSIDDKSLLIGILGTALVMVLMGQSSFEKQYQIECVPDYQLKPYVNRKWNADIVNVYCRKFDLTQPINKFSHKKVGTFFDAEDFWSQKKP